MRKKYLTSVSISLSLDLSRDVFVDVDEVGMGPVIVNTNIDSIKASEVKIHGPVGSITANEMEGTSISLRIDEQVILAIGPDDIREYENANEGISAYVELIIKDLRHKLFDTFRLEE